MEMRTPPPPVFFLFLCLLDLNFVRKTLTSCQLQKDISFQQTLTFGITNVEHETIKHHIAAIFPKQTDSASPERVLRVFRTLSYPKFPRRVGAGFLTTTTCIRTSQCFSGPVNLRDYAHKYCTFSCRLMITSRLMIIRLTAGSQPPVEYTSVSQYTECIQFSRPSSSGEVGVKSRAVPGDPERILEPWVRDEDRRELDPESER